MQISWTFVQSYEFFSQLFLRCGSRTSLLTRLEPNIDVATIIVSVTVFAVVAIGLYGLSFLLF